MFYLLDMGIEGLLVLFHFKNGMAAMKNTFETTDSLKYMVYVNISFNVFGHSEPKHSPGNPFLCSIHPLMSRTWNVMC